MVLAISLLLFQSGLALASTGDIEFVTTEFPWAVVDRGYSPPPLEVRVGGMCPEGGVGFSIVSGTLPVGLQFSRGGTLSGIPRQTGEFSFMIRATNGCSWIGRKFSLTVTGAPVLTVTPATLKLASVTGESPKEEVIHISSTWPKLPYQVAVSGGSWLKVVPEHGFTPRISSALIEDRAHVRVDASALKAGHYECTLTISAWQALAAIKVRVELIVQPK